MMTMLRLKELGVSSFMVIHDDYGTHAADAELMYRAIRESFRDLYELDPLKRLAEELEGDVPPLPDYGSWKPSQVIESRHFFG